MTGSTTPEQVTATGRRRWVRAADRLAVIGRPFVDRRSTQDWPAADVADPHELLSTRSTPETIAGWKALSQDLLSDECCAFHRNMEISSRYAWLYRLRPASFKWAAMAAIASHHVRLVLYPLRLDADGTGYVDLPSSLSRSQRLLAVDVNTIRKTNNAIFDDIFWAHLAYVTADDGIERLRSLIGSERHYAPMLTGFEAIHRGCLVIDDPSAGPDARKAADDLVWSGNLQLLEHEQRALVQPHFDLLSCAFARIVSLGALTSFEVRGVRQEIASFTSFFLSSLTWGFPHGLRANGWPRITRFDDRWRWFETSVVPHFRRLDAETSSLDASLRHIADDARVYASMPCVVPR